MGMGMRNGFDAGMILWSVNGIWKGVTIQLTGRPQLCPPDLDYTDK